MDSSAKGSDRPDAVREDARHESPSAEREGSAVRPRPEWWLLAGWVAIELLVAAVVASASGDRFESLRWFSGTTMGMGMWGGGAVVLAVWTAGSHRHLFARLIPGALLAGAHCLILAKAVQFGTDSDNYRYEFQFQPVLAAHFGFIFWLMLVGVMSFENRLAGSKLFFDERSEQDDKPNQFTLWQLVGLTGGICGLLGMAQVVLPLQAWGRTCYMIWFHGELILPFQLALVAVLAAAVVGIWAVRFIIPDREGNFLRFAWRSPFVLTVVFLLSFGLMPMSLGFLGILGCGLFGMQQLGYRLDREDREHPRENGAAATKLGRDTVGARSAE